MHKVNGYKRVAHELTAIVAMSRYALIVLLIAVLIELHNSQVILLGRRQLNSSDDDWNTTSNGSMASTTEVPSAAVNCVVSQYVVSMIVFTLLMLLN